MNLKIDAGTMLVVVIAATIFASPVSGARLSPQDQVCQIDHMPIDSSFPNAPIQIAEGRFLSSGEGPTYPDVRVTGVSPVPIDQVSFVLDYLDGRGLSIGQVAFASATHPESKDLHRPIHAEYVDELRGPALSAGQEIMIHGMSDYLFSSCPASAKLTFLFVSFADNTNRSWAVPDWKVGPTLNFFSSDLECAIASMSSLPFVIRMRAKVDRGGRIVRLDPIDNGSPVDTHALLVKLKEWSFFPGLVDGKPSNSYVIFELQFLPSSEAHLPFSKVESSLPLILIKAVLDTANPDEWKLFCEWRYGGSFLEESERP